MRSSFLIAFFHPANLVILALAVAAGLCSAWWLFPIGLVLWGVMMLVIVANPALRASQKIEARITMTPRFQTRFEKIQRIQLNLMRSLSNAPDGVRKALQPVLAEVDSLVEEIYQLCQRSSDLENYRLVNLGKTDLDAEWVSLSQQIETAADPRVKQELEDARSALEQRITQQRRVLNHLDRVDAQLLNAVNNLDNLQSEVLRLQSMGDEAARQNRDGLLATVRQLKQGIEEMHEE